jgi:DNA-binding NarL/FixJ family response regulator
MRHPIDRPDVTSPPALEKSDVKILKMIAIGSTNREIAAAMKVSTATTGRRLTSLLERLGARDRTHAVVISLAAGLMQLTDVPLPTWTVVEMLSERTPIPDGG